MSMKESDMVSEEFNDAVVGSKAQDAAKPL